MAFLKPFAAPVYALMRIVLGFLFLQHGTQKLFGWPAEGPGELSTQLWIGAVIELVGGALLCVGMFTPVVAFVLSGTMAVAFFQFHVGGSGEILPLRNNGELAAVYCWVFLYIATRGSGIWSLDGLRGGAKPI